MSMRRELPWDKIQNDVISAIDVCNDKKTFVSTKKVITHILKNQDDYPNLMNGIRPMTRERAVGFRVSRSLNKLNWPVFSYHSTTTGSPVYIDPRYR